MGRNTGGIYSLPGSAFVSGTVISSTAVNSKFNDIATALTDSLSRTGNGDMLAPLRVPDGSAAIPSMSWSSDIGTGFYLAATSSFRAVILASTVQEWTATSVAINKALTVTGNLTLTGNVLTGLTITNSTTNGAGVTSTGNGTGAGVVATGGATGNGVTGTGGSTSGTGGVFTGTGGGNGVTATGQGAGAGISATGGATDAPGVIGAGQGTGEGGRFTGGSGGIGVRGTGTNNHGGVLTGGGSGAGLVATGAAGVPGVYARNGTAATGATPQYGLIADNSYISLDGTTAPDSTVAIKNAVTPANLINVRGKINVDGLGGASVVAGFNIASVSIVGGSLRVTFAQDFADSNYSGFATNGSGTARGWGEITNYATTHMDVSLYNGGGVVNLATTSAIINVSATGLQ